MWRKAASRRVLECVGPVADEEICVAPRASTHAPAAARWSTAWRRARHLRPVYLMCAAWGGFLRGPIKPKRAVETGTPACYFATGD
jgi:hypothetical protein